MNKSKGFTLIEFVVVLGIIFVLLGLSFQFFANASSWYARIEMEKLYAFCLYVQRQAQIEHKTKKIVFDKNKRMYSSDTKKCLLHQDVLFGFPNGAKGPPSNPKKSLNDPITFVNSTILFYPDGTISSGVVYLADKKNKAFYALSSGISQISFLRRYKFNKKWILIS